MVGLNLPNIKNIGDQPIARWKLLLSITVTLHALQKWCRKKNLLNAKSLVELSRFGWVKQLTAMSDRQYRPNYELCTNWWCSLPCCFSNCLTPHQERKTMHSFVPMAGPNLSNITNSWGYTLRDENYSLSLYHAVQKWCRKQKNSDGLEVSVWSESTKPTCQRVG